MTPVVAPLRRFFPVLALVLSAATFADVLPTPSAVEATARSLAAIERNGVNLDNLTLDEILRDSREAKLAYALREKLRSAGSAAISPLTVVVLQCKRPKTLKLLLDALADLAPKGVADGVLRRLEDPRTDSTLRRQIPRFIGRLGDASHAALLEELANDKDFLLSREAVFALGVLPNKAGVPALYRILDKGPDVCRGAAAETMGEIDEFPAIEKLIEKLMDPDPYVRTFAQTSLTELTYRCAINRPVLGVEQQRDWQQWWKVRKAWTRTQLVDECFREGLAALAGSDARFGLEYATWLAELTFQNPPASALFSTPLASVALAMEANRWKGWIKDHPSQNRLEWFRQAIDRAIETLQNPDAPVAWPGLSALSELLPLPASEPYLFRAAWVREPLAERAQLARVYQDWWSAHRVTFTPLGKKYW